MSAPVPLSSGCCAPPCPSNPQTAVPGPAGENAFSLITANFTQPAVGASVNVTLNHDGWVVPGQTVFVQGGGFYSVASVSGLTVAITNLGASGNASPGSLISVPIQMSPGGVGGTTGNAYTTTAANFTQPAVNSTVNVQVLVSAWAAVGQVIFIAAGGYYTVFSIPDSTHITVTNLGYPGNAAPASNITSPRAVSPGGLQGPTGATGISTLNGVSPTTTKGDLIVDNGANNPAANDVRQAVGTNGQLLASDSTQATGLGWKTVLPNTAATSGDIPIFSGTSGTPMALVDSKMLITATGALQSTPTGGNARGTSAVDLQVVRVANTQVASGNNSGILAGESNTASAQDSCVAGGNGNTASGSSSHVGGGLSNTANNTNSAVCAGTNNTASGSSSCVGAGNGNVASGQNSTIAGGASNAASAFNSFVGGGGSNGASQNNAAVAGGTSNNANAANSFVGGGTTNTASGSASSVVGGNTNSATAANSSVPGGANGSAYLQGQIAHASGNFAAAADAQTSETIYRISTTDATAGVEMFLDGAAVRAVVPLNTTWAFLVRLVGRSSAGVCAVWETKGGIQNNANTVSLIAANTQTVVVDGTGGTWGVTANFAVTGDNVNKSLKLAVTGAGATNIRWVAHARLVEVNF